VGAPPREWLEFDTGMLFLRDNGRFAAIGVRTDSVLDALAARIARVQGVARLIRPADLPRADTARIRSRAAGCISSHPTRASS